jgi:hypothetical protein
MICPGSTIAHCSCMELSVYTIERCVAMYRCLFGGERALGCVLGSCISCECKSPGPETCAALYLQRSMALQVAMLLHRRSIPFVMNQYCCHLLGDRNMIFEVLKACWWRMLKNTPAILLAKIIKEAIRKTAMQTYTPLLKDSRTSSSLFISLR